MAVQCHPMPGVFVREDIVPLLETVSVGNKLGKIAGGANRSRTEPIDRHLDILTGFGKAGKMYLRSLALSYHLRGDVLCHIPTPNSE